MEWEKEFDTVIQNFHDDELEHIGGHCPCSCIHENDRKKIKAFIHQALESQMSDLRKEVEKVKEKWNGNGEYYHNVTEALDEVLLLMKK